MDGEPNVTAAYGAREYWLLVNDSDECHNFHIHQTKFVVLDADFSAGGRPSAAQCLGDRGLPPPINRNVLHDNYALPPGSRVFVMIRFDGPKLGRFVLHCHIMEHEDKGRWPRSRSWTHRADRGPCRRGPNNQGTANPHRHEESCPAGRVTYVSCAWGKPWRHG